MAVTLGKCMNDLIGHVKRNKYFKGHMDCIANKDAGCELLLEVSGTVLTNPVKEHKEKTIFMCIMEKYI